MDLGGIENLEWYLWTFVPNGFQNLHIMDKGYPVRMSVETGIGAAV
jgi:hypothetical protein